MSGIVLHPGDLNCDSGMSQLILNDLIANMEPIGITPVPNAILKANIYSFTEGICGQLQLDLAGQSGGGNTALFTADTSAIASQIIIEADTSGTNATHSLAQALPSGTINIPLGQTYNINNVPLSQNNITGLTTASIPMFAGLRLGISGLQDIFINNPVYIGDDNNRSLNTVNQTIFGSINELLTDITSNKYFGDLTGTSDQIYVVNGSKAVFGTGTQLSLPQNIGSDASPYFNNINLTGMSGLNVILTPSVDATLENIDNIYTIRQDPTGFDNPGNVTRSFSTITNEITLAGSPWQGYWRGQKVSLLSSTTGYTSSAIPSPSSGNIYWYYYNGSSFAWSSSFPGMNNLLIGLVYYGASVQYGLSENHGLMEWDTHGNIHSTVGTYIKTPASIITTGNLPVITAGTIISDEDLQTTLPGVSSGNYTQFWLTASGTDNYSVVTGGQIVHLNGLSVPYYNQYSGSSWTQTLMTNKTYMTVWVLGLPVMGDTNSQKYAILFVQGQSLSTTQADEEAKPPSSVNMGTIGSLLPEMVFLGRFTINYNNGGGWSVINTIVYPAGTSKFGQGIGSASGYLTAIVTDGSGNLTGNGTSSSPLGLAQSILTTASPSFVGLTLSGFASAGFIANAAGGALSSVSENTAFNQNFETSTSNIKADGSVSVGVLSTISRADHIHPTQLTQTLSGTTNQITVTGTATNLLPNAITLSLPAEVTLSTSLTVPTIYGSSSGSGTLVIYSSGGVCIGTNSQLGSASLTVLSTNTISVCGYDTGSGNGGYFNSATGTGLKGLSASTGSGTGVYGQCAGSSGIGGQFSGGKYDISLVSGTINGITSGTGTNYLEYVATTGKVTYGAAVSSLRYKNIVSDNPSEYLKYLYDAPVKSFTFKDVEKYGKGLRISVIAEKLFELKPEYVFLDKEGRPDSLSMQYLKELPFIHSLALQDHEKRIKVLEKELEMLKMELTTHQ